jgi:hypothetical protein
VELEVSDPILWEEIRDILWKVKGSRAAGPNGIPPEFFKAISQDTGNEEPQSHVGKALFQLLSTMWLEGRIPAIWKAAQVVSVPKKGDLMECDNYRGISLIAIGCKILSALVASRLSLACEGGNVLCNEQAGF